MSTEPQMQHLSAPQENIQTWNNVTKLIVVSCVAIIILLSVMALTLL
jgi:hypothetical protein